MQRLRHSQSKAFKDDPVPLPGAFNFTYDWNWTLQDKKKLAPWSHLNPSLRTDDSYYRIKRSQITNPSNCINLGGVPGWSVFNSTDPIVTSWRIQHAAFQGPRHDSVGFPQYTFGGVTRRHAGLGSMVFMDGRVKIWTLRD